MFEEIDKAAENLAKKDAGWVFRRDAAEALGEAASRALDALKAHAEEPDMDVRSSVDKALGQASGALAGVRPQTQPGRYSLEELARACEKPGTREVEPNGDGYAVDVQPKAGRHQTVYVMPFKRKDGVELIRVYTLCGPARPDALSWALRTNMKLAQCAFAMMKDNGEEQLVLMNCYLAGEASPTEIKVAVKEVAYYGDWIENKLTGLDDF